MTRWIAGWACAGLLAALPVGADEHHSHPAPERLGTVRFATSCGPAVARDFERAVALLHSFAYDASESAFRSVLAAEPACAMAHWGVAMSLYHQLWSPPDTHELSVGRAELALASEPVAATQRERQFIAAAAAYFDDYEHRSHAVRVRAYRDAMGVLAADYPKDAEVEVFYALALIASAPPDDKAHLNQKQAGAILEPIYRDQPEHPGVAHYLIHAYDSAELAPRGLAAARAYAKIAPSVPHALHMPSHIFTRLGLWDDSIASNLAARAAAHREGDVGEELHAMDYLSYAYLQQGRDADASQVVAALGGMGTLSGTDFKIGYAATAMPIRLAMERHQWEEALGLEPLPESAPHVAAVIYWARAEAHARSGHPAQADGDIALLDACNAKLDAAGSRYWQSQVHVLGIEARAWQAAAAHQADEATRLLAQAADEEDGVEKLPVTPGPIVPAREQLGDLLLDLKRPREALIAYQVALREAPGRRGSMTGAIKAADAVGDTRVARQLRRQLTGQGPR